MLLPTELYVISNNELRTQVPIIELYIFFSREKAVKNITDIRRKKNGLANILAVISICFCCFQNKYDELFFNIYRMYKMCAAIF